MKMRFPSHTPETATGKAADLLNDIVERTGSAGTMVRTMAGSASILAGYLELSRAMKRSKLDRHLSERISLAVQDRLGCGLCLQAHTSAARALGISEDEIARARKGGSADAHVNVIVDFGCRVYTDPSSVSDDDIVGLRLLGLSDREILDIVGLVALNVLTGTFNLVAGLRPEIDTQQVA
jgi:AhpD family alkylhydroperoxidase